MRPRTMVTLLAVAALSGGAGIAVAGDRLLASGSAVPLADDVPVAPPAVNGNQGAAHQHSVNALRDHLTLGGPGYLRDVDWQSADSFPVPGTQLRGWKFDQPGKRCLALPDPVAEGYGVTCRTPQEIAAGKASVMVLPSPDSGVPNVIGALTSGGQLASIEPRTPDVHWQHIGDVSVGIAPAGSHLVTAGGRQKINPPPNETVTPSPRP